MELIYRELGKYVLRDNGIYSFHSLDCVKEGFPTDCNAIILGRYNENPIFKKYLKADEIPENGYAVKVIDNPENNDFKLALLCGYSAEWIESGEYAYQLTKHIKEKTGGNINMCMAGMFSGGIWFPTALCAEMFWNCEDDYNGLRKRVLNRNWVRF